MALGNYTSKIRLGAIGRQAIADGQVQAAEPGTIEENVRMLPIPPGGHQGAFVRQRAARRTSH